MIIYHTDGSCSPNPGPGGFAVICNEQPVRLGYDLQATNIRMEGQALIAALTEAATQPAEIYTDSEFWINVLTKWAPAWQANNWHKKGGEIKNLDLVQQALELYQASRTKLIWVRGHNKDPGNELADQWANKARHERLLM
jgi:ribonuclease HI